ATDACGNAASCSQIITVVDNTPPVLTKGTIQGCYKTKEEACAAAQAARTASDDCSAPVILTCKVEGDCSATVTVTGTDACGNSASVTYTTRIDNIPPVVTGCPVDATYQCLSEVPAPAAPTGID